MTASASPATADLFSPIRIGAIDCPNRVLMSPLTRCHALPEIDVPHALNATYYEQRASAGLIISEATQVSPQGKGYVDTPGMYSPAQEAGWRLVTDAVHAAGGRIVAQLWHVGSISHPDFQPGGALPHYRDQRGICQAHARRVAGCRWPSHRQDLQALGRHTQSSARYEVCAAVPTGR